MKLRNIIITSFAVCALAACSKEEPVVGGGTGETVDASISFAVISDPTTKAETQTSPEKRIKKLVAYVFENKGSDNSLNKLVTSTEPVESTQIRHITVKVQPTADGGSTDQFIVVFLANATPVNTINSLNDLLTSPLEELAEDLDVANNPLPMVSKQISFGNLKPNAEKQIENWIAKGGEIKEGLHTSNDVPQGYEPIEIERLVARVQVDKLSVSFDQKYPNASFELLQLALANVRNKTTIDKAVLSFVHGFDSDFYTAVSNGWIYKENSTVCPYLRENYSSQVLKNQETYNFGNKSFVKYIYFNPLLGAVSNDDASTALVITGNFVPNINYPIAKEKRHYRVYLNDVDVVKPAAVLRNTVYKLNVTLTGEGSPNPDEILETVGVSLTLTVKPWEVYEQNEDITN